LLAHLQVLQLLQTLLRQLLGLLTLAGLRLLERLCQRLVAT